MMLTPSSCACLGELIWTGWPSKMISPGILLICAGQNFHKRGFPCAVFAQQRVDLAALNAEADVVERQNAREPL